MLARWSVYGVWYWATRDTRMTHPFTNARYRGFHIARGDLTFEVWATSAESSVSYLSLRNSHSLCATITWTNLNGVLLQRYQALCGLLRCSSCILTLKKRIVMDTTKLFQIEMGLIPGWNRCFQMSYLGPDDRELRLTTEVNIIPDWLPFRQCSNPDDCQGVLRWLNP